MFNRVAGNYRRRVLRSRWTRGVLLAVPGLALAGFGMIHPATLDAGTASWWARLHIILLAVFPLLAAAQWVLLTPAPPALRWLGRLAAFGFAAFYTGLDAVAGIAAGTVTHAEHGLTPVLGALFATGDTLGYIGVGCFLTASTAIALTTGWQAGWRAAPGALLLLAGSVSFIHSHIFWPRGVITMLALAAGMFLLSLAGPVPEPATAEPSLADSSAPGGGGRAQAAPAVRRSSPTR